MSNHARQSAPPSPESGVRAKRILRTEDHHAATAALSRAMHASGIPGRALAREMRCDEALIRGMGSGIRPCTWQRLYHAPIALRRQLAAELLHDGAPASSVDVASGLRLVTARLGIAAQALELALSPMGPGGVEMTDDERVEMLRALTAIRLAVDACDASVRRGGR